MPSFADIKSHALKAKDSATDKFSSTRDRFQSSSSKNYGPSEPRSKLPPPPPPPLRSTQSPSSLGRSQPDPSGLPPPVARSTRPDASSHLPSPSPPPSVSPSPPGLSVPGFRPPSASRFNSSPKPLVDSQPAADSIDWANLSDEDKQVFFSWLDEFFVKFTGDDSFVPKDQENKPFVPKDQENKPVPASKWNVPSSMKDAMASMVGEKGQGPPPPIPTWSKPDAPASVPPPQPTISVSTSSDNFTSYPPQPTHNSAAEDLAYYFHPSTHWDSAWYDVKPPIPPPAMIKQDLFSMSGQTSRRGNVEVREVFYGVFCRDLSVFWGKLKITTHGSKSPDPNQIERSARFLPCPQPLDKEALVEAHNIYGETIASFAEGYVETQQYCARGECWDLASEGLKYFEQFDYVEKPIPSLSQTHGHLIASFNADVSGTPIGMWRGGDDRVRRGDIVQWKSVKIEVKMGWGHGTATLGDPDHTAIIVGDLVPGCPVENGEWFEVARFGTLEVVEQSVSTGGLPKNAKYDLSGLKQGEVWIYRPVGMKRYIGTEFSPICPEDIETQSI